MLADREVAILGGELWLVRGREIWGVLPSKVGPPGVYHWRSERRRSEAWNDFVERTYEDAIAAIHSLPPEDEVLLPPGAQVFYNLTWAEKDA